MEILIGVAAVLMVVLAVKVAMEIRSGTNGNISGSRSSNDISLRGGESINGIVNGSANNRGRGIVVLAGQG